MPDASPAPRRVIRCRRCRNRRLLVLTAESDDKGRERRWCLPEGWTTRLVNGQARHWCGACAAELADEWKEQDAARAAERKKKPREFGLPVGRNAMGD